MNILDDVSCKVDLLCEKYKGFPYASLLDLIEKPYLEKADVQGKKVIFSAWAERIEKDRLVVAVEGRRERFLGWSQVYVVGFSISKLGVVTEVTEEEMWSLGY